MPQQRCSRRSNPDLETKELANSLKVLPKSVCQMNIMVLNIYFSMFGLFTASFLGRIFSFGIVFLKEI